MSTILYCKVTGRKWESSHKYLERNSRFCDCVDISLSEFGWLNLIYHFHNGHLVPDLELRTTFQNEELLKVYLSKPKYRHIKQNWNVERK